MAAYIDHTLLKPEADQTALEKLCQEAVENRFKAVCLNSGLVYRAAHILNNRAVEICSVVGVPPGGHGDPGQGL